MSIREGLLLDPEGSVHALLKDGQFADWEFRRVANVAEADEVCAAANILVGVVRFTPQHAYGPAEIEGLATHSRTEWLAIAHPDMLRDSTIRALVLRNFYDYHTDPVDPQRLRMTLGHAYGRALMMRDLDRANQPEGRFGMIGRSAAMQELYRQIDKVVRVDAPVLIRGESGTGKELVARAIHCYSARAGSPFVAVNCGAIPGNLIQSELFGHERGAFTGAVQRKIGSIETANGGVLFLDEIGDLSLDLQSNLLRFLQEKTIVRVGSTQSSRVDVRVLAATHIDLQEAVRAGRFREDLLFRLNVLGLKVPPLRERGEDIDLLAEAMFRQFSQIKSPQVKGFSSEALKAMREHDWPGNVRELINRIQQSMIMSEHRMLNALDLGLSPSGAPLGVRTLDAARANAEREIIVTSLRKNHNNVSQTARQLGVSRVTLYRMMSKFNIIL